MKRLGMFLAAGVLCMSALVSAAHAEGFALFEWSARGNALGGAMVGRADDPSAVAFNPAGITQLVGKHFMTGLTSVTPSTTITTTSKSGVSTSTKNESNTWLIPHAYYTQQLSDDVWFGFGLYSRFGLGVEYPKNWPGRTAIKEAHLETVSATPVIAYKINDEWSVSVGAEVMQAKLKINKNVPVGNLFENDLSIKGDSYGIGGLAGVHYKPNDEWAFGLSYKSQVRQKFEGEASFDKQFSIPALGVNMRDNDAHGTLVLPDEVLFGAVYRPTDRLSIEAGFVWTNWSTYNSLNLHIDNVAVSKERKNWKDTMRYNLGVEYALTEWMDIRGGYTFDESPVHGDYADYLVPTNDRHLFSTGVGFKKDDWTLDLSYTYIWVKSRHYDAAADGHTMAGESKDGRAHMVGMSVGYTF